MDNDDYGHKYQHGTMTILSSIEPITLRMIAEGWTTWNRVSDDLLPSRVADRDGRVGT